MAQIFSVQLVHEKINLRKRKFIRSEFLRSITLNLIQQEITNARKSKTKWRIPGAKGFTLLGRICNYFNFLKIIIQSNVRQCMNMKIQISMGSMCRKMNDSLHHSSAPSATSVVAHPETYRWIRFGCVVKQGSRGPDAEDSPWICAKCMCKLFSTSRLVRDLIASSVNGLVTICSAETVASV